MQISQNPKLYNDKVSYINAAGNYIFYTRRNDKLKSTGNALLSLSTTGLFRITKNGTDLGRLYEDPTQVACLYGNNIYYQHYDQKEVLNFTQQKLTVQRVKNLNLKLLLLIPYPTTPFIILAGIESTRFIPWILTVEINVWFMMAIVLQLLKSVIIFIFLIWIKIIISAVSPLMAEHLKQSSRINLPHTILPMTEI